MVQSQQDNLERDVLHLLHPAVIHFPITLLLLNGLLTLIFLRRPDLFLERSAYGALVLGWWGALVATITGVLATAVQWPVQDDHLFWVNAHAVLGGVLLLVYGRALLMRRRDPQILHSQHRRAYLLLLLIGMLLVVTSGWTGGHLVYQLGIGVR